MNLCKRYHKMSLFARNRGKISRIAEREKLLFQAMKGELSEISLLSERGLSDQLADAGVAGACKSNDGRRYAWQEPRRYERARKPCRSGSSMSKRCQELRLVTMEIAMHRIVARVPSVLNIRVIGDFVVSTVWMMLPRTIAARAVSDAALDSATACLVSESSGFSQAFQRSHELYSSQGLSLCQRQAALNLLFYLQSDTAFTILCNTIGSSPDNAAASVSTIEPHNPDMSSASSSFVWNISDRSSVTTTDSSNSSGRTRCSEEDWRSIEERVERISLCLCTVLPDLSVTLLQVSCCWGLLLLPFGRYNNAPQQLARRQPRWSR